MKEWVLVHELSLQLLLLVLYIVIGDTLLWKASIRRSLVIIVESIMNKILGLLFYLVMTNAVILSSVKVINLTWTMQIGWYLVQSMRLRTILHDLWLISLARLNLMMLSPHILIIVESFFLKPLILTNSSNINPVFQIVNLLDVLIILLYPISHSYRSPFEQAFVFFIFPRISSIFGHRNKIILSHLIIAIRIY